MLLGARKTVGTHLSKELESLIFKDVSACAVFFLFTFYFHPEWVENDPQEGERPSGGVPALPSRPYRAPAAWGSCCGEADLVWPTCRGPGTQREGSGSSHTFVSDNKAVSPSSPACEESG